MTKTTTTGLEPVRGCRSRFLVYLLNHSDKLPEAPHLGLEPRTSRLEVLRSIQLSQPGSSLPSKYRHQKVRFMINLNCCMVPPPFTYYK